mgnify:CR=1 FL=1
MTDAAMTVRYAAAELVEKLLNEIELITTSTGSYNVDFGSKWIGGVENRMKELYVPGGSASSTAPTSPAMFGTRATTCAKRLSSATWNR